MSWLIVAAIVGGLAHVVADELRSDARIK